ncbi:MAG: diguanylate cyclase [Alphaproteobacteria bacterium]|nr:diguanylate cyclase [Alphaproteobacteria bacterium]
MTSTTIQSDTRPVGSEVKFFEVSDELGGALRNMQMKYLYDLWETHRDAGKPNTSGLPELSLFSPEAHPWLAGDLIVVRPEKGGFHYDHYGGRIASKAGFDMTSRNTRDFPGHLSRFFAEKYRQCLESRACLYTMHHAQASQAVISWERLLLPVRDGDEPVIVCYNVPLHQKNSIYEAILESSLDGIVVIESSLPGHDGETVFRVVAINHAAEQIFGVSHDHAVGNEVEQVLPLEYIGLEEGFGALMETGEPIRKDVAIATNAGQSFFRVTAVRADSNIVLTFSDITALRQSESALQFQANELVQANEFLEEQGRKLANLAEQAERDRALAIQNSRLISELFDSLPMPVTYLDIKGVVQACNDRYAAIFNRQRNQVIGHHFSDIVESDVVQLIEEMNAEILRAPSGRQTYEVKLRDGEGAARNYVVQRALIRGEDGQAVGIASALVDFTEEYELRSELERLATTDVLTGLFNRRVFTRRGREEMDRAQRHGQPLAVILFDIDRFKKVNDTLGHDGGDLVLQRISNLMRDELRKAGDLMARYGGEEFIVLLPQTDLEGAGILAERLRVVFEAEPVAIGGREYHFTSSFGVAEREANGVGDLDALVKAADEALYTAKRTGRNRVCFAPALDEA